MAIEPIPEGYHSVTPYLVVAGAAGLIDFLKAAFDATEQLRMHRPDGSVQHAEVRIGDSPVMLADPTGPAAEFGPRPAGFYLDVADCDSVYRRALAAGGTSLSEPADMPHGDRYGGVRDPSGNVWWIASRVRDVTAG